MELRGIEVHQFTNIFERFKIENPQEKRAIILCTRGESALKSFNYEDADLLFKQARELCPNSSYLLATIAQNELQRGRISVAENLIKKSFEFVNKSTGGFCYSIAGDISDNQRNRKQTVDYRATAIKFEPNNMILRHKYGLSLGRLDRHIEAIKEYDYIIDFEKFKELPGRQILFALRTKIISLKKMNSIFQAKESFHEANLILDKFPHLSDQRQYYADFSDIV